MELKETEHPLTNKLLKENAEKLWRARADVYVFCFDEEGFLMIQQLKSAYIIKMKCCKEIA